MCHPELPEPPISDEEFGKILRQFFQPGVTPSEAEFQKLADMCHVSRPTLKRWWNGRNLPYRAVRNGLPRVLAAFQRGEWTF